MVGGYALRYALEHLAVKGVIGVGRRNRHLASQVRRGIASRLHGLLRTREGPFGSGGSSVLPGRLYRGCAGRGASQDHRELDDRVRASPSREQPWRHLPILEREWRGPDRTKSDALRSLQRKGRESTTRGGIPQRLYLPSRVHLSSGAAEGAEFQLPHLARDLL